MASFHDRIPTNMWRVVFYERRGNRIHMDRTGPWLPQKQQAQTWARWFTEQGYHVALQDQSGQLEKLLEGLPS
ncbi:MAG: hypothetical protein ABW220_10230 [Burkholderiaceae bacterium]